MAHHTDVHRAPTLSDCDGSISIVSVTSLAHALLDTGILGVQGAQGFVGAQGIRGDVGLSGPMGLQGRDGLQGLYGIQGMVGAQGVQGLTGSQGMMGLQGFQGKFGGPPGPQGAQGFVGTQGFDGAQGSQGSPGSQGPMGIQGAQGQFGGPPGPHGAQGTSGTQGANGAQGSQGSHGAQGPAGPTTTLQFWRESGVPNVYSKWDNNPPSVSRVDMIMNPANGGAFYLGGVADGTVANGASRGNYAADLQRVRTVPSQVASGDYAFAVGLKNSASGLASAAIGNGNHATGNSSFAAGGTGGVNLFVRDNFATGPLSIALGGGCISSGTGSLAEGLITNATNQASHAEGITTNATGVASHAGGVNGIASGNASLTHGFFASADAEARGTAAIQLGGSADVGNLAFVRNLGAYSTTIGYNLGIPVDNVNTYGRILFGQNALFAGNTTPFPVGGGPSIQLGNGALTGTNLPSSHAGYGIGMVAACLNSGSTPTTRVWVSSGYDSGGTASVMMMPWSSSVREEIQQQAAMMSGSDIRKMESTKSYRVARFIRLVAQQRNTSIHDNASTMQQVVAFATHAHDVFGVSVCTNSADIGNIGNCDAWTHENTMPETDAFGSVLFQWDWTSPLLALLHQYHLDLQSHVQFVDMDCALQLCTDMMMGYDDGKAVLAQHFNKLMSLYEDAQATNTSMVLSLSRITLKNHIHAYMHHMKQTGVTVLDLERVHVPDTIHLPLHQVMELFQKIAALEPSRKMIQRTIMPSRAPGAKYRPRTQAYDEWVAIQTKGFARVQHDGTCRVGDRVTRNTHGHATRAERSPTVDVSPCAPSSLTSHYDMVDLVSPSWMCTAVFSATVIQIWLG